MLSGFTTPTRLRSLQRRVAALRNVGGQAAGRRHVSGHPAEQLTRALDGQLADQLLMGLAPTLLQKRRGRVITQS